MNEAIWLEVALNGPWSRERQPKIPITADEIVEDAIASADAGASIVHFHAYDPVSGRQRDDYEIYAPIIERIRSQRDVICYPTLPFAGSVDAPSQLSPAQRFEAVEKLAQAGLIEWATVDPGSTNITHYADIPDGRMGFVYSNPESHVRYGLELAKKYGIVPSYAIYEPGFARLGAALHSAYPGAPTPIYRLMFSDGITFGFPPSDWALDAYLRLLEQVAPQAHWMIAGLAVDIEPLIETAVARLGHIRVGLEDAPFGCTHSNATLTDRAVQRIEHAGRRAASTAEIRAALQQS
ncbi:3-keto-5-aminohexanoate cleavage protein [Halomonas alkalisoli]|uniref:3-keto-5-aminohexanoate cleavage protein n=1 Tax=Halomonas alkalisoli TaxID=2907158 RepID=UPI001F2B0EB8|nr:3-keto-5-aminohexanoate cleavage protein [Halomonas alkalisoli]MCE9683457.1 3-keto-5-aminohexanoate cleavage protein [Halomonas alkalisoli]